MAGIEKILKTMLLEAGYDAGSQEAALKFVSTYLAPCPAPVLMGIGQVSWKSLMTDDFSPIEYSWVWSSVPKIRYSVELVGSKTGSSADPLNQLAALELVERLKTREKHINWELFELLLPLFRQKGAHSVSRSKRTQSDPSTIFLAFEPWECITNAKAYFLPPYAPEQDSFETIAKVLDSLYHAGLSSPSLKTFRDYIIPSPTKPQISYLCIGIDCVQPVRSRLKFYVRSSSTSFKTVRNVLCMGNTSTVWTDELVSELKSLWALIFGRPEDFAEDTELSASSHETAGILYYIDIHPSNTVPATKIYLPVKHYGRSDDSTFKGLARFLEGRTNDKLLSNFERVLQQVSGGRNLESNRGIQTYISCVVKAGALELTSYLSPELYKRFV